MTVHSFIAEHALPAALLGQPAGCSLPAHQGTHEQALPTYPGAFKPLSREDVASLLGISLRTLGNWRNEGLLPEAVTIGSRCYWHPERFYAFLNAKLLPESTGAEKAGVVEHSKPLRQPTLEASPVGQRAMASSHSQTAMMLEAARGKALAARASQVA
jgi:hypothetical protein